MRDRRITKKDIASAYDKIAPHIRMTPVVEYDGVTFKLEFLQHTGSFKARGAFANVLLRDVPKAGVAAASGGNHGVAVACAAQHRGVAASIFVPKDAPAAKKALIKHYGAEFRKSQAFSVWTDFRNFGRMPDAVGRRPTEVREKREDVASPQSR